jgi:hypothetical protein
VEKSLRKLHLHLSTVRRRDLLLYWWFADLLRPVEVLRQIQNQPFGILLPQNLEVTLSPQFSNSSTDFFRLTPALLATILLYLSVIKHVLEGPIWLLMMKKPVGNCISRWWTTVLLVSNFLPLRQQVIHYCHKTTQY